MTLRQIAKTLLTWLPPRVERFVRALSQRNKRAKARVRKQRTVVSYESVRDCIAQFQFETDILIHSSVSNIGRFDCPVPRIVDCLLEAIDTGRNTVLAPALPFTSSMKEYLDGQPVFDVRRAPNAMGVMSNVIMHRDGATRSLHPTHSIVALGPIAEDYVRDHHCCRTPFGEGSPFLRLQRERGKVLMFGVGLNSVTNFHVYEDMLGALLPFNAYVGKEYEVSCVDIDGDPIKVITACHSPLMSARRDCERARKRLLDAQRISTVRLGEGEISLLDAHGLTVTLLEMLLNGESIYGSVTLSATQRAAVERCLAELQ